MTVYDPGAGQQQGRECNCRGMDEAPGCNHGGTLWHPAPSPTPPARWGREGCTCGDDTGLSSCVPGCPCRSCRVLTDSGRDDIANGDPSCSCGHPPSTHDRIAREPGTLGHGACDLCSCRIWDSGRDEAREAVARWLWEQDGYLGTWERDENQDYYREDADRLLALPELDKLLRRPA